MILYLENEIWTDVDGYNGIYQVSTTGKVRSIDRQVYNHFQKGKELKPHNNGHGYLNVSLHGKDKKEKHAYIHILVAKAFIPNPNNYTQVNHKDFNKTNNNVENLEWVSPQQNKIHYRNSRFCKDIEIEKFKKVEFKTFNRIIKNSENIIKLRNKGLTIKEISKKLELGRDFVSNVLNLYKIFYKNWRN
jgi:hypothetical protein